MQFRSTECEFFGHVLTPDGIKVDPKKVEAVTRMQPPTNKQELSSFLGLVNYMKRYSSELTKLGSAFRELQKEYSLWSWETSHQAAFEDIKVELMKAPVLAYFDPKEKHMIQTDASQKGLGAVLLQQGRPVIYASCALYTNRRQLLQFGTRTSWCNFWSRNTS